MIVVLWSRECTIEKLVERFQQTIRKQSREQQHLNNHEHNKCEIYQLAPHEFLALELAPANFPSDNTTDVSI